MSTYQNHPIHHVNLSVPNLEKALDFYTNVLSYQLTDRFQNGEKDFAFLTDGTVTYEMIEKPELTNAYIDHIAYASTDIQADYEHFKATKPESIIKELGFVDFLFENGMYFFFIEGPAGEKIEFCQQK